MAWAAVLVLLHVAQEWAPLMWTTKNGSITVAILLIRAGADVNAATTDSVRAGRRYRYGSMWMSRLRAPDLRELHVCTAPAKRGVARPGARFASNEHDVNAREQTLIAVGTHGPYSRLHGWEGSDVGGASRRGRGYQLGGQGNVMQACVTHSRSHTLMQKLSRCFV
jgi:hypothetical protein